MTSGRAEFKGLPAGTRVGVARSGRRAARVAGVRGAGERRHPADARGGGFVARRGAAAARAAPPPAGPAQPGKVVLGDESRFVFEMGEDGLTVFYILQILNAAAAPVQPRKPLVFELPADARGAAILEGSSPQATVSGRG